MILIGVAVLVIGVTVLFTLSIRAKDVPPPEPISPTAHLEDRKAAIYENLRDLQFEYRVGKLSDEDYQLTKLALQKELAVVVAEVTRITGGGAPVVKPVVAATRPEAVSGPTFEVSTTPRGELSFGCPHCHAQFPTRLKFCGECGKQLS